MCCGPLYWPEQQEVRLLIQLVCTVGSFSTIDSDDSLGQEFALDGNFERFTSLFLDKQNFAVMDKHLHLD